MRGNRFEGIDRAGIYSSGKTDWEISDNLFVNCGFWGWSENADAIEQNTFVKTDGYENPLSERQSPVSVLGASTTTLRQNVFVGYENAVRLGDINGKGTNTKSSGKVTFESNCLWKITQPIAWTQSADKEVNPQAEPTVVDVPIAQSNRQADPGIDEDGARIAGGLAEKLDCGASEVLPEESPWAVHPGEAWYDAAYAKAAR